MSVLSPPLIFGFGGSGSSMKLMAIEFVAVLVSSLLLPHGRIFHPVREQL
jgi:hypothetical protein